MTKQQAAALTLTEAIIAEIKTNPGVGAHSIAETVGKGYSTVTKHLRDLMQAGKIAKQGSGYAFCADAFPDTAAAEANLAATIEPTNAGLPTGTTQADLDANDAEMVASGALDASVEPPVDDAVAMGEAHVVPTPMVASPEWDEAQTTVFGPAAAPQTIAEIKAEAVSPVVDAILAGAVAIATGDAVKAGSIAAMVLATINGVETPHAIAKRLSKSTGAVGNACKMLVSKGLLALAGEDPVRYARNDAPLPALVAPSAPKATFAKRAPQGPTSVRECHACRTHTIDQPCPKQQPGAWHPEQDAAYLEPHAIGVGADESTYLRDHPGIEVYVDERAVLDDNKQDLNKTLGKRTVRYFDYLHGMADVTPHAHHEMATFICGSVFEPESNHDRLLDLDRITAPWGGRTACGAVEASWAYDNLRDPGVYLRVELPRSISDLLTIDGKTRKVYFLADAHNDSSHVDRWRVIIHTTETNTAILLRGTSLDLVGRHTRGSLRLSKERIEKLAAELPAKVAAHADALRRMAGTFVDTEEMRRLCLVIANLGDDVVDDDASNEKLWERAMNMDQCIRTGTFGVPKSPLADDGQWSLYQIFEAAAAIEPMHESWVEYTARMIDGRTYANVALQVLDHGEIKVATMPAHYAERMAAAYMLPDLMPMPEGYSTPVNVAAIRLAWCTALAADDTEADERIARMNRPGMNDPITVLKEIAPYVPLTEPKITADDLTPEQVSNLSTDDAHALGMVA